MDVTVQMVDIAKAFQKWLAGCVYRGLTWLTAAKMIYSLQPNFYNNSHCIDPDWVCQLLVTKRKLPVRRWQQKFATYSYQRLQKLKLSALREPVSNLSVNFLGLALFSFLICHHLRCATFSINIYFLPCLDSVSITVLSLWSEVVAPTKIKIPLCPRRQLQIKSQLWDSHLTQNGSTSRLFAKYFSWLNPP